MTGRIAHVLARCSGVAACARCAAVVTVTAGRWLAADAAETHRPICDACAQHDDPQGHMALLAWRRASNGPAVGRKGRS